MEKSGKILHLGHCLQTDREGQSLWEPMITPGAWEPLGGAVEGVLEGSACGVGQGSWVQRSASYYGTNNSGLSLAGRLRGTFSKAPSALGL